MNYIMPIVGGLMLLVIVIIILRELALWYFKINNIEKLLIKNNELLEKILNKGETNKN